MYIVAVITISFWKTEQIYSITVLSILSDNCITEARQGSNITALYQYLQSSEEFMYYKRSMFFKKKKCADAAQTTSRYLHFP